MCLRNSPAQLIYLKAHYNDKNIVSNFQFAVNKCDHNIMTEISISGKMKTSEATKTRFANFYLVNFLTNTSRRSHDLAVNFHTILFSQSSFAEQVTIW